MSRDVRTATGIPLDSPLQYVIPPPIRAPTTKVDARPTIPSAPTQPATVEPPIVVEKNVPATQTLVPGPASVSSTEPMQGESNVTPMVVQPTGEAPLKVRFRLPSQPARKSAHLGTADMDYHGPDARATYLASESALVMSITPTSDEPKSIAEAMSRPDAAMWSDAILAELQNLISKGTWEETSLPKGRKAIGCKWVLKTKTDANGNVVKYKARLVAQGFSQQPGIDFEETFAPVSRSTSLLEFSSRSPPHTISRFARQTSRALT